MQIQSKHSSETSFNLEVLNIVKWAFKASHESKAPIQIPMPDFIPDLSIPLSMPVVQDLIRQAVPNVVQFSKGTIDFSKVKEKTVIFYAPDCKYADGWHAIDLTFKSFAEQDKRVIINTGNDIWTLDSLGTWIAPKFRIEKQKLFIDVQIQINWAQNIEWPGWVLEIVMGKIRNDINPRLPNPMFTIELPNENIPLDKIIDKFAIRISGCWFEPNGIVYIDIKFAN